MIRLLTGDVRDMLATLPANSVHTVVTSPPYYALRSYLDAEHADKHRELGSEPTPEAYLATMVQVFRELRRVLRDDGSVFCNLGDSYQDKQLLMMPARLALALQADGWWLRSDIIWAKPNPMPESVTDRPTSAHEHVFLLTKLSRYFYDADAVREEASLFLSTTGELSPRAKYGGALPSERANGAYRSNGLGQSGMPFLGSTTRSCRNVWTIATAPLSSAFSGGSYRIASRDCAVHDRQADLARVLECDARQGVYAFGRNPGKRSRPAELPEGAVVSIPADRCEFPSDVSSATGRSTQTHRTPALSKQDVIFGDIPGGHIGCRGFLDHSFAMYARTPASNTLPDASPGAPQSYLPARSSDRIVGIATYTPRPEGCTCYYAGTVHKRQDHFASFPPELAERCIRAGTSERGCCAQCGKPWGRQVELTDEYRALLASGKAWRDNTGKPDAFTNRHPTDHPANVPQKHTTTGWAAGCQCNAETRPCVVLDCFSGAGTALLVADRLGRDAIGIDLSHAYVEMTRERLTQDCPLFADIADAPVPEHPEENAMADLFAEAAE